MSEQQKYALAAILVGGFLLWFINSQWQPGKASTPRPAQATANETTRKPEPKPEPPPPEGTWTTTTEILTTRSCKYVGDRKEGARRRAEATESYQEIFRGTPLEDDGLASVLASSQQDPVVERCRKVTIKSPKAAGRRVYRELWSLDEHRASHSVWCNGEAKKSPENDPEFMIAEIKKRPGCVYRMEQEREVAPAGEPTTQIMLLYWSNMDQAWTFERRVFIPSKSWLD